jgi:hypothetical protein
MNREKYETKRKKLKQNRKNSTIKNIMLESAKKRKQVPSEKLREEYSTKVEWVSKTMPKLKET